jgi:NADH:ubiquinone reductase (H+-translocating)
MTDSPTPRIVIVGAGFGGLNAARVLANAPVKVTIIDRRNYHTFQPLLYQVATAGLSPGEIAEPIRSIFRSHKNVEVLMAEVTGFDLDRRLVETPDAEIPYDYLIVAAGASHAYFGHEDWEPFAPGLKTIEDAIEIRRRVLLAFELAERQGHAKEAAAGESARHLNFVVVGGGPTGVELAGTLAEIARHALTHEFRSIDPSHTHILLIEGGPRVLPTYAEDLSRSAQDQLHHLGVEVRTSSLVTRVEPGAVYLGEMRLPATVILWAAGVAASPLGKKLGVSTDRAGRVPVQPDLSLPGYPQVFVIGDLATLNDEHGKPLPGVAPVAMQQGRYVAQLIRQEVESPSAQTTTASSRTPVLSGRPSALAEGERSEAGGGISRVSPQDAGAPLLAAVARSENFDSAGNHTAEPQTTTASSRTPVLSGRPSALAEGERSEAGGGISRVSPQDAGAASRPAFHYWDKGSLATIGRAAAVAEFGKFHISGFLAWLSWLFVHIFFLIGFQNRILVLIQWAWSYMTYERGARLITGSTTLPGWPPDSRH